MQVPHAGALSVKPHLRRLLHLHLHASCDHYGQATRLNRSNRSNRSFSPGRCSSNCSQHTWADLCAFGAAPSSDQLLRIAVAHSKDFLEASTNDMLSLAAATRPLLPALVVQAQAALSTVPTLPSCCCDGQGQSSSCTRPSAWRACILPCPRGPRRHLSLHPSRSGPWPSLDGGEGAKPTVS